MAQKFDPGSLRLNGEPFLVAEHVTVGGLRSTADFSVSDDGVLVYGNGASSDTRLTWFDRQGKQIEAVAGTESYRSLTLSPDGKTVAAEKGTVVDSSFNLWLLDLARHTASRFTFEPFAQNSPVWSPDGKGIFYAWQREDSWGIYRKDSSGIGSPERVFSSKPAKRVSDVSRDGRWLVYNELGENGKQAVWSLPLRQDHASAGEKPIRITEPEFNTFAGVVSPDGKFLAYSSFESSRMEVYVRSFHPESPGTGGKWQISASGGNRPLWSRDGKELFFISTDDKLMAVSISSAGRFQAGVPKPLFELRADSYAVSSDGKRILAAVRLADAKAAAATVVLNWTAELGK